MSTEVQRLRAALALWVEAYEGDDLEDVASLYGDGTARKVAAGREVLASTGVNLEGWLPIEDAPKDGTEFLAFKAGICQFTALILTSDDPSCEFDGGVHCTWDHSYVEDVTHYMPLPPDPQHPPKGSTP